MIRAVTGRFTFVGLNGRRGQKVKVISATGGLLEGDWVDVWGQVRGLRTYTAVLGNQITIPEINSAYLERVAASQDAQDNWRINFVQY